MPNFKYSGRTANGAAAGGTIAAAGTQEAFQLLKKRGIIPLKIEEAASREKATSDKLWVWRRRLKMVDVQHFCLQVATMLESGLPIARALTIIAGQGSNEKIENIARKIADDIIQGKSIHAAASQYRTEFGDMLLNLIAAGEESGEIDKIFREYAGYLDERIKLTREIKGALIYPTLLFIIGIGVSLMLTVYVIPKFAEILENGKFEIPTTTIVLLHASDLVRNHYVALLAGLFGAGMAIHKILQLPKIRLWWDRFILGIPGIGNLVKLSILARFSRTMAMLLKSGVPFLRNLQFTIPILENSLAEKEFSKAQEELEKGVSVRQAFDDIAFLPGLFLSLIEVGESSGKLDKMLEQAAIYYEGELKTKLKHTVQLFEPGMLMFISVFVGFIAITLVTTIMRAVQSF